MPKQEIDSDIKMVVVDGKILGVLFNDAHGKKEVKRLMGLIGVEIQPASEEAIKQFLPHFYKG